MGPTSEAEQLAFVESLLTPLPDVTWDRFAGQLGAWAVYGWIDRSDAYKDFVVVEVQWGEDGNPYWWYVTSSARYSETFAEVLGLPGHTQCRRAESVFKHLRTVRL